MGWLDKIFICGLTTANSTLQNNLVICDFSYSDRTGAAVVIKNRKEEMYMALHSRPGGVRDSPPKKRQAGPGW